MKTKIGLSDFSFSFSGYGRYKVTFFSTKTNKGWHISTNSDIIGLTWRCEHPKQKDLITLKKLCKNGNN